MSSQMGEWQEPLSFHGDFYRQTSDVCRGVNLALSPAMDFHSENDFKGLTEIDFNYHEPDSFLKALAAGRHQFTGADHPPNTPSDQFFNLQQVTTLHVTSTVPFTLGNHLLELFGGKATPRLVSLIIKSNFVNFSIKAHVFINSMKCTLKARIYHEEGDRYAIEFRRLSGDCVAFNRAYHEAAQYFAQHCDVLSPQTTKEHFATQRIPSAPESIGGPLLDMVGCVEQPSLQGEAARVLADAVVQDDQFAHSLCSPPAFGELKKLLRTDSFDVAYPAASLLSSLASRCPEAVPGIQQDDALMQGLREMMETRAADDPVRRQLSEVWRVVAA